ncbi:hypothetical protein ATO6_12165 [Oceanicola sp. 22II-s10i]|uniref:hypothetical protein n=1 Tax=Oceanicola sp. 22II-s10i TaxID=1317116 RepID=UPI000B520878|nr:hypothetical protein [Oceanicola sp. 22II-s10i]OWU84449.1 hypothetical protein ATO6_12165 [Oceanicola sp. 22II-s10i]
MNSAEDDKSPVRFLLLMPWGRVGSNLVSAALSRTQGIMIENEPTTAIRTIGHRNGLSKDQIGEAQIAQLDAFLSRPVEGVAAGLKLSFRSLITPETYLARLAAANTRPVLITRENVLKCAVSQLRARALAVGSAPESGHWRSPWAVRRNEPKPGAMPIDVADAIRLAGVFQDAEDQMMDLAHRVFPGGWHRVEYRDLAARPEHVLASVFAHLGLTPPDPIPVIYRKSTSDDLTTDITNYGDFEAEVKAAGLGRFLSDIV